MEDFEAALDVFLNEAVTTTPSTRYSIALRIAEPLRKAVRRAEFVPPVTSIVSLIDECVKKAKSVTSVGIQRQKASFFF